MNQFHKASKLTATKGLTATLRNPGKLLVVAGLAGVLMATTACGGAVEANPAATSAPIASETVAGPPKSSTAGTVVNGIPTKPELAFDGKNYYVQTTIADNDPAMTYDPAKSSRQANERFSPDELADGQKFATKFVVEEVLDSIINDNHGDKETVTEWLDANKDKLDPAQYASFADNLNAPYDPEDAFLLRGVHREGKYELVSGPDQTRVLSRTITPTVIRADTIESKNYVEYEVQVRVAYKVKLNGQDTVETVDAKIQTVLGKDPVTNKWFIAGANNKFTPTPAV